SVRRQEVVRQIAPFRFELINELELPGAPALEAAFAYAGLCNRSVFLEIDEPDNAVFIRKARDELQSMLGHTPQQVVRNADVENAIAAIGENVGVVATHLV